MKPSQYIPEFETATNWQYSPLNNEVIHPVEETTYGLEAPSTCNLINIDILSLKSFCGKAKR